MADTSDLTKGGYTRRGGGKKHNSNDIRPKQRERRERRRREQITPGRFRYKWEQRNGVRLEGLMGSRGRSLIWEKSQLSRVGRETVRSRGKGVTSERQWMLKETKSSRRDMFSALAWAGEVDLGGTRDSSFVATNTDRLVDF